jgi:hypothetical protein
MSVVPPQTGRASSRKRAINSNSGKRELDMIERSFAVLTLFAVSAALAGSASAAYPPSRNPDTSAPPSLAAPHNTNTCTAVGTWFETGGFQGDGSWSKTAKRKCKIPGVWTDAFGYTWTIKKAGKTGLKGSVNYNGIPACTNQVWPVAGSRSNKTTFTVTATNPNGSDPNCVQQFGYDLVIQ